jgi:2,4-dichlorophenol 6-monooxygenase
MVRTWNEWLLIWGYDINQPPPVMTEESCREIAWNLIGDRSIPVDVTSWSTWTVNHMHATTYQKGRVFCMGDAVHRHPPSNGLGSNTSIQDAYNLAWKLALVLKGHASERLLDTYSVERAPIGKQVVDRANKSIGEFGPIFAALGLLDSSDPDVMKANMEARKEDTPESKERRRKLRDAIAYKQYEFDAHGVEMNQFYVSSAIVCGPGDDRRLAADPELVYQPSSCPGARIPHVWIEKNNQPLSTLDVVGQGRFTLLTGIGGSRWREAAAALAATGFPIRCITIGPSQDYEDPFGDWARASEIDDDGALLVRPDQFIAWRHRVRAADCTAALKAVIAQIAGTAATVSGRERAADRV